MTHSEQPSAVAERRRGPLGRVVVLIPTYNERENLPRIVARRARRRAGGRRPGARRQLPGRHRRGRRRARRAPTRRCTSCTGRGKEGLGAAYLAGFGWALDRGYDVAGRDGRRRLAPARAAARAAGRRSRTPTWSSAPGGCPAARWSTGRCTARCSRSAATSTPGSLLGMPVRDATGGYRAYRAAALKEMDLHDVASQGYCFQVDLVWRAVTPRADRASRCRSRSSSARSATPR